MIRTVFAIIIAVFFSSKSTQENVETIKSSQNCDAELTVEKNRSFQSADEDGAEFKLTLTNTSSTSTSYELKATKLLSPCSNNTKAMARSRSKVQNSNLDVSFKMDGHARLSKKQSVQNHIITLEAGQSKDFYVHASVPEGTPFNTWGCIEVEANSIRCSLTSAAIVLSIFIPDPAEE
jgi:hypothetical protein